MGTPLELYQDPSFLELAGSSVGGTLGFYIGTRQLYSLQSPSGFEAILWWLIVPAIFGASGYLLGNRIQNWMERRQSHPEDYYNVRSVDLG